LGRPDKQRNLAAHHLGDKERIMIIEKDGTITQVGLTEYQADIIKWRKRSQQVCWVAAAWVISLVIWLMVIR
jgi:hypothetical protein